MSKLSAFLLLAYASLIARCNGEPRSVRPVIEPIAYTQQLTNGTYEILLRYSVTTSGGMCFSSSFFTSTTHYETNWLYVKSIEGVQTADQVVVRASIKDNVGDFTYPIEGMTGTVSFTNKTMIVDLEQPKHPDGVHAHGSAHYYLNGIYTISTN